MLKLRPFEGVRTTDQLATLEGQVRRGEFVQAIREAERLMMLPDLSPREMGRLFRLVGRANGEVSGPYTGLKLLELAIPWALKAKDWDCLGATRADLGWFWLLVGDIPSAVESLQAYLVDLPRYDIARGLLGHVHYNLGLAYRRRRDYLNSIKHYEAAVAWFTEKGYTLQAAATHQNLCWLYCLIGQVEEAERELQIAESFAPVCDAAFRTEQLVCRAFVHKNSLRIGNAIQLVEEVFLSGRPGCQPAHKGHAAWIAASIALDLRQYAEAMTFTDLATAFALEAQDTGLMSQVTKLKSDIARGVGDGEQAAQ